MDFYQEMKQSTLTQRKEETMKRTETQEENGNTVNKLILNGSSNFTGKFYKYSGKK